MEEEGGGEKSLSIAETNKLRLKLGLKPLKEENTDKTTVVIDDSKEENEMKKRIDKIKRERLRKIELKGSWIMGLD